MIMEYKLAKKAYGVNWDKIDEGSYYSGNIDFLYAESRGKAKSALLPELREYELSYPKQDITYLNAPVIRMPHKDLFFFGGKELTMDEIIQEERLQKRRLLLDEIATDESIKFCYIKRRGQYYRPNRSGYVDYEHFAGVYEKMDAISSALSVDDLKIIPIDIIEHNKMIQSTIQDLQKSIIATK